MSSDKTPTTSLVAVAWSVLLTCALLWLAAWLIEQVWGWLLLIFIIGMLVWITLWILRWRRDRW